PRLGTRHQHGLHSWIRGAGWARAVRRVESRRGQPDARARARVGRQRRHGERDLPWSVRHRDESAIARESGDVPGIRASDSNGAVGRVARAGRRGVNVRGAIDQLSEADWDKVVDTNLKGPFLCARACGPRMVRRGWGRVINMGSILGSVALAGRAPYAASKAGVVNLTRVLALEWAGS